MAETVPLFRLVVAVLVAGGVAGAGAVFVAPRLGIGDLAGVEPFVAGVAGGVAALVACVLAVAFAATVLDGVVEGLYPVLAAGYALAAALLSLLAATAAWRRLGSDGSGAALARWAVLSVAGFGVVGLVTAGLSALLLWVPRF